MYPRQSNWGLWFFVFVVAGIFWLLLDISVGPIPSPSQVFGRSGGQQVGIADSSAGTNQGNPSVAPTSPARPTPAAPLTTTTPPSSVVSSPVAAQPTKPNGVVVSVSQKVVEVTFNGTTTNYGFNSGEVTPGTYKVTGRYPTLPNDYRVLTTSGGYTVRAFVTLSKANATCSTEPGLGISVADDAVVLLEMISDQAAQKNIISMPPNSLVALLTSGHLACGTTVVVR